MGKGFMERVTRLELASRTPLKLGFSGGPAPLDWNDVRTCEHLGGGSVFERGGREEKIPYPNG